MEWLQDIGKNTRRGIVRAAKHTEGVMEMVGTVVDAAMHTADSLIPSHEHEVLTGEVAPTDEMRIVNPASRITGRSSENAAGGRKHVDAVPVSSLHATTHRARTCEDEECDDGGEVVIYSPADVGPDQRKTEGAPMSRGLLGLGMQKLPRRTIEDDFDWPRRNSAREQHAPPKENDETTHAQKQDARVEPDEPDLVASLGTTDEAGPDDALDEGRQSMTKIALPMHILVGERRDAGGGRREAQIGGSSANTEQRGMDMPDEDLGLVDRARPFSWRGEGGIHRA
jgi:hypothetical protein